MEGGCADSAGSSRSRAASTARRSSSKKAGSFIVGRREPGAGAKQASRLRLAVRIKGLGHYLAVSLFEKDLDSALGLFELLLTLALERNAFFKKLHGIVEGELRTFQAAHHFFESRKRALEIGLLWRLGPFWNGCVHALTYAEPMPSSCVHFWQRKQQYVERLLCSIR